MPVVNQLPTDNGKWDLLWTNPNPNSAINNNIQINVDLTQYEYVFTAFKVANASENIPVLVQSRIGDAYVAVSVPGGASDSKWVGYRHIDFTSGYIKIGTAAGYMYYTGNHGTGASYGIPVAFYGVKRLNLG